MRKKVRVDKTGRPPGWLQYTGQREGEAVMANRVVYDSEKVQAEKLTASGIRFGKECDEKSCWMDIRGLHDVEILESLGKQLGLNRLILEDVLNVNHPPKLESGSEAVMLSVKYLEAGQEELNPIHVNLFLSKNSVVSLSDSGRDLFSHVYTRLKDENNKLRTFGADHLFLRLVDLTVDHYLPILSGMRDHYDQIQERLIGGELGNIMQDVLRLRSQLIVLRQAVMPLKAALLELQGGMSELLSESAQPYLTDVLEHLNQAAEEQRSLSDSIPILIELHHANLSNHMNGVMKTLTVVASIFIPLTFLAGIYGMNFEHMPELSYPWAYPTLLGVMLVIVILMLIYMRRKRWL